MRANLFLLCICSLFPLLFAAHQKRVTTKGVAQLEIIYPGDISVSSSSLWKRSNDEDTPDSLDITLTAFGKEHSFSLEKNFDLFTPTAKVTYVNGKDESTFRPRVVSYKGKGDLQHNVRLTILEVRGDDLVMKGFFNDGDETYFVDPITEHLSLETRSSMGANMVIYKDSDILVNPEEPIYCGSVDPTTNITDTHEISHHFSLRDHAAAPPLPQANCPTSLRVLTMSVVGDHNYNTKIRNLGQSDVAAYIQAQWNTITQIYERTVNVRTVLDEIIVNTAATSDRFNAATCPSINDKLYDFSRFRGTRNQNSGLWHLMTGCYTSGTVGLAWISVLCRKTASVQGSQTVSGTGVSSHLSGAGSYRVAAHEMGHNFGSQHTQDGVMIASNINSDNFHRDSQTQMCNHIYSAGSCMSAGTCTPNCAGKDCGSNGCGGSCGTCPAGRTCSSSGQCGCTPSCNGKTCGSDGCGGSCGTCTTGTCSSSGTCAPASEPEKDTFLRLHNAARAAKNLSPVVWSDADYQVARSWAAQCQWKHSSYGSGGRGNRGENLAAGTGSFGAENAVNMWVQEESSWKCDANTCSGTCGHYTQVVWHSTTAIGCAVQTCTSGSPFGSSSTWRFVVCNYSPPGNYVGERPFPVANCDGTCTPTTSCSAQGRVCGTINTGCGTTSCGTCPTDSTCDSQGRCVCRPTGSCTAQGRVCGTFYNGCENVPCGNCTSGQTCNAQGRCDAAPCVPTTSCAAQNKRCGTVWNGCTDESCGSCISPQSCVAGVCTGCTNCHQYATCTNNNCVCRSGYTGDGTQCTPVGNPGTGTAAWRPVVGTTTGWRMTGAPAGTNLQGDDLEQVEATTGPHVLRWLGSENLFDSTYTSYSADIQLSAANSEVGLALSINPTNSAFWTVSISTSRIYLTGWNNGYYTKYRIANRVYAANRVYKMEVLISDQRYILLKINGEAFGNYTLNGGSFTGAVGLFTLFGPGKFANAQIYTRTALTLALTTCETPDEFRDNLANALGIPPSAIGDVQGTSGCPNKKRQGAFSAFSFSVTGTQAQSASSISSQLSANHANGHISLQGNGIGSSSVAQQPSGTQGVGIETLPIEEVAAIAAAGLTAGIIAAIVIGAVLVTGGATAATVVGVKKYRARQVTAPAAEIPMSTPTTKKPKGVDVYNFDPASITSLTGRAPPQQI